MEFLLLGPLEVVGDDGAPIPLGGRRRRALLALLLLSPNEAISTDRLIEGIWGESPPPSAGGALQVHVHALRKALGADRVVTRPPGYLVRVEADELDLARFERLLAEGRHAEALALWRGPALADIAYEPFAFGEAARLENARLTALEARVEADLEAGRHDALTAELEALAAAHPHRERLQAHRMLALYRSGRQADALAAYRETRATLDELGIEPSAALRSLEQQMLRQDPGLDLAAAPVTAPPTDVLPADPTPLVGRELEVGAVLALLDRPDTRLVTLTGPGGTGKTRLALAVAGRIANARAVFVDLSAVTDAALVLSTVAHALGAGESPGADPVETVFTALGAQDTLLVLDNLEQVLDAAADVARLVDAHESLRVLVTSRAPLRVTRERVYAVPPLTTPETGDETAAGIERVAAVRLYAERARAADPAFAITDANAPAVARICRALDGLPLALELAAARVRTLGPEGTAARLGERLSLLSRGARDLPERQRSLRATLDWSVQLLDDDAVRVLASLGAFSGGASLDAVESVVVDSDVLTALDDLLDAALLTASAEASGEPRFGMLETVREYATELLTGSGTESDVRDRHLDWCLRLVEGDVSPYWRRPLDASWLARVELEHDNLRAAFAHAAAAGHVEREVRLANGLRYFWRVRGYVDEGRRRLERAVELAPATGPAIHARTLVEAGVMAFAAADYPRSRELLTEALDLLESTGSDDAREIARARMELGTGWHAEGDLRVALGYYEAALVALDGVGDENARGVVLGNLAAIHHALGDLDRARDVATEVLVHQRELGDDEGVAVTSLNLGAVELERGDLAPAATHVETALDRALALGFLELAAYAFGIAAQLALATDRPEDAGVLCGVFQEQFRVIGGAPQTEEGERHDATLAEVERRVDAGPLVERGTSLTLDDATAVVRDVLDAARAR